MSMYYSGTPHETPRQISHGKSYRTPQKSSQRNPINMKINELPKTTSHPQISIEAIESLPEKTSSQETPPSELHKTPEKQLGYVPIISYHYEHGTSWIPLIE